MSMMHLAFMNFRNNFKNYLSLVISLAFTVLVFMNFQNIIYTEAFEVLGRKNREYVNLLVQVVSFVLVCFMFFFIWYSTNVFLTRRKKEIGIYVFMGLSNQSIGKLYMVETMMIGLSALAVGIGLGIVVTGLFQMILLAISDIAVDIQFHPSWQPVWITVAVYVGIYGIFVLKGYVNIVRSSVMGMILAAKQNEYIPHRRTVLFLKAVAGGLTVGTGYYLAMTVGQQNALGRMLAAVVLVTAGAYLLFGGLVPLVFQGLAANKQFLYRKQRILWINHMIFGIRRNYRTYAIVSILMLCSVTALATSFAMKLRYDNIIQFESTYTFQVMSSQPDMDQQVRAAIEAHNEIAVSSRIPILTLDDSRVKSPDNYSTYGMVSYSALKQLAEDAGLAFSLKEPGDDEIIKASHLMLMSFITDSLNANAVIDEKVYRQTEDTNIPYLGYLQELVSFYVVNDREYQRLKATETELHVYNYRVTYPERFSETRDALDGLIQNGSLTGRVAMDPGNNDLDWVKVLYSMGIFMFLVFVLASGSIMFMKLYNDAFEEKERFLVMKKIGMDERKMKRAVAIEMLTAYSLPFVIMAVSSYFSVHALETVMLSELKMVNVLSVLTALVIFVGCWRLSVGVYWRNVQELS